MISVKVMSSRLGREEEQQMYATYHTRGRTRVWEHVNAEGQMIIVEEH
jgi:hypothetical protein